LDGEKEEIEASSPRAKIGGGDEARTADHGEQRTEDHGNPSAAVAQARATREGAGRGSRGSGEGLCSLFVEAGGAGRDAPTSGSGRGGCVMAGRRRGTCGGGGRL